MSAYQPDWANRSASAGGVADYAMGVGSEVYAAVSNDRRAIGIELKPSYYRQATKNLQAAKRIEQGMELFEAAAE